MEAQFKIVYEGGSGEIVEKKSRFIATVVPVASENEALAFVEAMRRKYWDATHNCYAYVVGERNETARCSDDGEPAQTAGRPMLDVLLGEGIHNTAVVVTRYFGGTLLGTGGLVRAYSRAVQEGLAHSRVVVRENCVRIRILSDYNALGKIQYIAGTMDIHALDAQYTENVSTDWLVKDMQKEAFLKKVTEATNGQAQIEDLGLCFAAFCGKEVTVLG
ncbi:MAG: YigZ family protein [Clostridiales bacterium]|nr:YigZ family protein [Clostridiales bacterium]